MTSTEDRPAHWQAQVSAQKAAGLTIAAWCTNHGISSHTLSYWRAKFQESPASNAEWVPVAAAPAATNSSLQIRIGAATVDACTGFDANLLRDVVTALAQ